MKLTVKILGRERVVVKQGQDQSDDPVISSALHPAVLINPDELPGVICLWLSGGRWIFLRYFAEVKLCLELDFAQGKATGPVETAAGEEDSRTSLS